MFKGLGLSRSRIVDLNPMSGLNGMLHEFNLINENSSSLTYPIMLRNDRGMLCECIEEYFWSKKNN